MEDKISSPVQKLDQLCNELKLKTDKELTHKNECLDLVQKIKNTIKAYNNETTSIIFVGNTNCGKTSLINCLISYLLDLHNLKNYQLLASSPTENTYTLTSIESSHDEFIHFSQYENEKEIYCSSYSIHEIDNLKKYLHNINKINSAKVLDKSKWGEINTIDKLMIKLPIKNFNFKLIDTPGLSSNFFKNSMLDFINSSAVPIIVLVKDLNNGQAMEENVLNSLRYLSNKFTYSYFILVLTKPDCLLKSINFDIESSESEEDYEDRDMWQNTISNFFLSLSRCPNIKFLDVFMVNIKAALRKEKEYDLNIIKKTSQSSKSNLFKNTKNQRKIISDIYSCLINCNETYSILIRNGILVKKVKNYCLDFNKLAIKNIFSIKDLENLEKEKRITLIDKCKEEVMYFLDDFTLERIQIRHKDFYNSLIRQIEVNDEKILSTAEDTNEYLQYQIDSLIPMIEEKISNEINIIKLNYFNKYLDLLPYNMKEKLVNYEYKVYKDDLETINFLQLIYDNFERSYMVGFLLWFLKRPYVYKQLLKDMFQLTKIKIILISVIGFTFKMVNDIHLCFSLKENKDTILSTIFKIITESKNAILKNCSIDFLNIIDKVIISLNNSKKLEEFIDSIIDTLKPLEEDTNTVKIQDINLRKVLYVKIENEKYFNNETFKSFFREILIRDDLEFEYKGHYMNKIFAFEKSKGNTYFLITYN